LQAQTNPFRGLWAHQSCIQQNSLCIRIPDEEESIAARIVLEHVLIYVISAIRKIKTIIMAALMSSSGCGFSSAGQGQEGINGVERRPASLKICR